MTRWEALARRYCAIVGRDPDALADGAPEWAFAVDELRAAMAALETFDVDAWDQFESLACRPPEHPESAQIIPFPIEAA